jgi:hypothetical protein
MARTTKAAPAANAVGAYVTALFDAMTAAAKADGLAYEMVKGCATVESTNAIRDEFKAAYIAKRKDVDAAAFDADKAKAAGDMAWSRVCAKAKEQGWVKPVAENAKAATARTTRAKASAGKVDGRTLRTGSRASNKGVKAVLDQRVKDVIVPETGDDTELQDAFDWVMEDESRMTLFVNWVKASKGATRTVRRAA